MKLPAGLIVSCQARADNPLHGPQFMGAMALAARDGGAVGLRANGPDDIAAVMAAGLPVIGINKVFSDDYPVYIEATQPKPEGPDLKLLETLARRLSVPVVAEGRYNTPALVRQAFGAGAHAVVVGTMITNPREITRMFVAQGVPV